MGRLNGPKWTPMQQIAIEDREHGLLLSAAAGSGKTAVLVERAVGLMCQEEEPVPAEALLIVTFTNAAAAELRGRLSQKLNERLAAEPPGSPRLHWLRRQQMMLGRAAICTVDSFCLRLLREHFRMLDIPPDFATGDEGTLQRLQQDALAETVEAAYAEEDFCRFSDLFGRSRSDAGAAEAILRLYTFLRSLPNYRDELERWCRQWEEDVPFGRTDLCRAVTEDVFWELRVARWQLEKAASLCESAAEEGYIKLAAAYLNEIAAEHAHIGQILMHFAAAEWDEGVGALRGWGRKTVRYAIRTKKNASPEELEAAGRETACRDRIKALRDAANERMKALRDMGLPTAELYEEDRRTAAPLIRALARAVLDFDDRFWAAKKEHKLLDFADLEHLALSLLWDGEQPTPLAAQIRGEYRAVMVAEYQATIRLQDTLYRCLAAPGGETLFLVGDIKQSIYRFRQADPTVFLEKKQDFPDYAQLRAAWDAAEREEDLLRVHRTRAEGGQPASTVKHRAELRPVPTVSALAANEAPDALDPLRWEQPERKDTSPLPPLQGARIMMNNNFRSAPGVIGAINGIMGTVMSEEVGGVDYAGEEGEQLALPPEPGEYPGGCELCLVKGGAGGSGSIAVRIREMLRDGFEVRSKDGSTRPCRPEDFAVLVRSWSRVSELIEALETQGLRVCCNAWEDLLDSPVLRPLVNLLRVLDNPAQDVELASVLLSPLGGMTNSELTALRAARPRGSLYSAILPPEEPPAAAGEGEQPEPPARSTAPVSEAVAKAEAFYHWLSGLRDLACTLPVDRLLDEILTRTGYEALVSAMPAGETRRDELQSFVELCCEQGGQSLSALVRRLEMLAQGAQMRRAGAVTRPGCVTVMTVHGSKGLEFPVVFYAWLERRFNLQDAARPVLFHPRWGIGLRLRGPGGTYATLRHAQAARAIRADSLSEEMRIFYVALTRARDRLVLVMTLGMAPGKQLERALDVRWGLQEPTCPGEWALAAALGHPAGGALWEMLDAPEDDRPETEADWPLEVQLMDGTETVKEEKVTVYAAAPDEPLAAQLAEGFAWRYPHAVRTGLAAKVSVTGLVHKNDEVLMERPAFLQKDGMTGAEKGTATHAFLQHADLELAGRDLQAEVRRQTGLALMAADTADKLDWPALEQFFKSGLYRRIQTADKVLREYDFISAVPAAALVESDAEKAQLDPVRDTVLIQGVADLVLVTDDGVEIVDYKTDRGKSAERLVAAYEKQLRLYARALSKRFSPLPVVKCTIYSFALRRELDVPLRGV